MLTRSHAAWLPPALLALLTGVAFANAVPNGFVWIDHWQIESGGLIATSWHELWRLWREPLGSMPAWEGSAPYARPAVILLLSLDHWLADAAPSAYHFTLVLLHLGNVFLVYALLCDLAIDGGAAFFAAAIFAVHPLQTAAVSWVSGIADPLFTLFALIALRCQLAASTGKRSGTARVVALLSFACALGAKETAGVIPFLLLALYLLFPALLAPPPLGAPHPARAIAAAVAPLFVVLAAAAAYRLLVLHAGAFGGGLGGIPLGVRLRTVPRLILSYVTLPLRFGALSVCDDYALSVGWDVWTLSALGVLVVSLAALGRWWRQAPYVAFGVIWMILSLVPVLNVVPILHYRADRFFYFPMIGWSLAAVGILQQCGSALVHRSLLSAKRLRQIASLAGTIVTVALTALTIRCNALFTDDITLFESTVRVAPLCREAHTTLGDAYLRAGRSADAAVEYRHAATEQADRASYVVMPKVLINLGMAQLDRAEYAAAADAFGKAHRLQPELLHSLFGLGVANLGLGKVSVAVGWLEQAYARAPSDPDVVFNLALGYDRLERKSDASAMYRRYLDIAPRGRARALAQARLRALGAERGQSP